MALPENKANFSFRQKLFHSVLRNTRWGDIIDAFQSIWEDMREQLVLPIRDQYNFEKMTETDLRNMIFKLGIDLPSFDGYTNSLSYFQKMAQSIIHMVTFKSAPEGYKWMLYVLNQEGTAYPLRLLEDGVFEPQRLWFGNLNSVSNSVLLDQEEPFVFYFQGPGETNPVPNPPEPSGLNVALLDSEDEPPLNQFLFLDGNEVLDYTVHFLLAYNPKFIESATEFTSAESERALYDITRQLKRKKEIPHFQRIVPIEGFLSGATRTTFWRSEDQTTHEFLQQSILINGPLTGITQIQLGTGGHVNVTASITGVQTELVTLPISGNFRVVESSSAQYQVEDIITSETYSWEYWPFSEVAFLDASDQVVLYSKFPTVQYHTSMLKSVFFDVQLI